MSDAAERAEKAARAKALLKKRQQQKASGAVAEGASTSRTGSPAPAPAPSTPPPNSVLPPSDSSDIKDVSSLFGSSTKSADFSEFGVLAAPSPLRPMPSPMALGRAVSSPPPRHLQHSPHSPVMHRQERNASTPLSVHAQAGQPLAEVDLHFIRTKYETEIAQLKADLEVVRSAAARETETLRSDIQDALSREKETQVVLQSSEAKTKELEHSLSHMADNVQKLRDLSANQQQTITLLVNDKAVLMDQAAELDPIRNKLSETQDHLQQARLKGDSLQERLGMLEVENNTVLTEMKELKTRLQMAEGKERSLHEQLRALEVDLEDNRRALLETRHRLEDRENELRIMKEDDRAEILEQGLSDSRERIEELGQSMNRLQENLATVTKQRDDLADQLRTSVEERNEQMERRTKLEADLSSVTGQLGQSRQQYQDISQERMLLQKELDTSRETIKAFHQQVATISTNLANRTRQQDELEMTLATTSRKLADTELSLQSLRSENLNILAQLEEVRPKLVELTNKTAEDEERISFNDRKIRGLEKEVEALEIDLHDIRLQLETADAHARAQEENIITVTAEKEKAEHDIAEGKKAHEELESVITRLHDELAKLNEERQRTDKVTSQLTQERDMLRSEINSLKIQLDQARYTSEELQRSEADSNEVLEEMRTELESLREQLFEKEQEVSTLRNSAVPKDRLGHGLSQSLSDELLSSLRDQHALEISNTHSRIRELESDLFDAKANEHTLHKRVAALEDELGNLLRQSRVDGRRSTSTRSHTPLSQSFAHGRLVRPRVVYEENLPIEVRRKRKISLGMLKARIESERAAGMSMTGIGLGVSTGSPLSRVSSIVELDETMERENGFKSQYPGHEPQSGSVSAKHELIKPTPKLHLKGWDESHIFWCHACKGDLVVL